MNTPIETLLAAYRNPHFIDQECDQENRPMFGYLTEHVPVEILHAAGVCPVRIQGGAAVDLASRHMQLFSCSYVRGVLHRAEKGEYDYLEGLVSAKTCDVGLSLFQIWNDSRPFKFDYLLSLPGNCDQDALVYFQNELFRFKSHLESYRKREISNAGISESLALYNELREIIEELWSRRNAGRLAMRAGQLIRVLKGVQVLPPETTLELLNDLKQEMDGENTSSLDGVRVLLIGNAYKDVSLVDTIEKCGGNVVFDDTAGMGRLLGSPIPISKEPLTDLANQYLCRVTGSYRLNYEARQERIIQMVKKWRIEACVNIIQKYCDSWLFEMPLVEDSLKEIGIPILNLEIDDASLGLGQLETRVQAFIEMVGGIV